MKTSASTTKPRCFVYLRRSQDREDRQSLSIEKQDSQVQRIFEKGDMLPIYLPPEERSAKHPGRPVFNEMLDRIENGEARYIAVWTLSRLSRNSLDGGRVIYALDTGKLLAIHTPTRVYRNTPDDKLMLNVELALAKKNNDDLSVQVQEGFQAKRALGQYPGPAPIGYVNSIIGPGQRNIIPDSLVGPKVQEIFKLAATGGYTLQDLYNEAISIGLTAKSDKPLSKQTLADLLKRRTYTGIFKYGGSDWTIGTYEPLISTDLYHAVQRAMGWERPVHRASSTSGRSYPYKGVLTCGYCGFNITAYTKRKALRAGDIKEYVFYTCTKKSKVVKCAEHQVSLDKLQPQISTVMHDYQISAENAALCYSWIKKFHAEYFRTKNQYVDEWIKDQRSAQKALDILDEKLESGVITDERYRARSTIHQNTLDRTTDLLAKATTEADNWLELAKELFADLVDIGDAFEVASEIDKRKLMLRLGSNWTLSNKKVTLTPIEPLGLLHKSNVHTDWRARPDLNRRSPP